MLVPTLLSHSPYTTRRKFDCQPRDYIKSSFSLPPPSLVVARLRNLEQCSVVSQFKCWRLWLWWQLWGLYSTVTNDFENFNVATSFVRLLCHSTRFHFDYIEIIEGVFEWRKVVFGNFVIIWDLRLWFCERRLSGWQSRAVMLSYYLHGMQCSMTEMRFE